MSDRKLERVPLRGAKLNEIVWGAILYRLWGSCHLVCQKEELLSCSKLLLVTRKGKTIPEDENKTSYQRMKPRPKSVTLGRFPQHLREEGPRLDNKELIPQGCSYN